MSNIQPFGTSTDSPTIDLAPIKAFGCTVIDFNVSADWSSQAGSLSFRIIENELTGDRLVVPVLGSPHLFELKDTSGNTLFQYIGLVESISRSSNNSKIYSVNLTSPLTILDATQVILDKYIGLGGSLEGAADFSTYTAYDFGHRNGSINVTTNPGVNHWWNVSNLINVFAIFENNDPLYDTQLDYAGNVMSDFGLSSISADGIPLIKLMVGLHIAINHLPKMNLGVDQRATHGGNLLFGRHNYNIFRDAQGVPYYYHFDALGFYNQIVNILGPQYRVGGANKGLREIISELCEQANLEYFAYIDIYNNTDIGSATLQESDPNWSNPANCSWVGLDTNKFTEGGKYGGTIRIQTINKNVFFNENRPFSNIAYNLIGLEVPDLTDNYWENNTGIHPGKRPINDTSYGLSTSTTYADPLDSAGLSDPDDGFTAVGTQSIANGGRFPVATGYWDSGKFFNIRPKSSDISIKLNDVVTMKVVTGGYQTRLITVPREYIKHYWGDITLPNVADPRETVETPTESLGQTSQRKIPVVTTLLDPRDVHDYILIDMQSIFGNMNIDGVLQNGIYAASMLEIRCAMRSQSGWMSFINNWKRKKIDNMVDYFFPNCVTAVVDGAERKERTAATESINDFGGLGLKGVADFLGLGAVFDSVKTSVDSVMKASKDFAGDPIQCLQANGHLGNPIVETGTKQVCVSGVATEEQYTVTGCPYVLTCDMARANVVKYLIPSMYAIVKSIGDTHYGKSWYVPVPYLKTIVDLDGQNLVGNFKRSWEITDSAYVEPLEYYGRKIPQSNSFIKDGKVGPFINYDHSFTLGAQSGYDTEYLNDFTNPINGQSQKIFNFSEYKLDQLCMTKYGSVTITHAAPTQIETNYSFLPYAYSSLYDRARLPKTKITTGKIEYQNIKQTQERGAGADSKDSENADVCDNDCTNNPAGLFQNTTLIRIPQETNTNWFQTIVPSLLSLDYVDNGRFCFPYIKVHTERVFLPQMKQGFLAGGGLGNIPTTEAFQIFIGAKNTGGDCATGTLIPKRKQKQIAHGRDIDLLHPFPVCVVPKSINYAQVSTRYVYGPWITSFNTIMFRGKIEYEQDDSLVPENFLIPTNFGQFGGFTLSQTSGLQGLNLAAQGRANSIDQFALFAVEEGSISLPGAPRIKRIGDSLYGVQQVTDIRINVSTDNVDTTYTFKTISPRYNKINRDLEKNLTKISNVIKKIKLK